MIQIFLLRGYPLTELLTHLSKVEHIFRQSLFQKSTLPSTQKQDVDNDNLDIHEAWIGTSSLNHTFSKIIKIVLTMTKTLHCT